MYCNIVHGTEYGPLKFAGPQIWLGTCVWNDGRDQLFDEEAEALANTAEAKETLKFPVVKIMGYKRYDLIKY